MNKAKTFALILAVAALSVAAPLSQAATTVTLLEVPYGLGPSTNGGGTGRDNSINGAASTVGGVVQWDESHNNQGMATGTRVMKNWQHTYIADWDTAPMMVDVDVGGQLTGWGSYTPNYYMAIMPRNHNVYPDPLTDWPDPADPGIVNISCVWSSNDWYEGDGAGFDNYNWSDPVGDYASTIWAAGDTLFTPMAITWSFPGGGDDGTGNPWPAFPDCTFIETFHTLGDYHDFSPDTAVPHGPGWDPASGVPKTPTNTQAFSISEDCFYVDDNGTPTDPLDDFWGETYIEVQIDQALIDDMFNNVNNRGLALWDWNIGQNGAIYSADQNAGSWPYIYGRIEVLAGDANLDKAVDGLDYVAWSNNYNLPATWQTGDFNNDLIADGLDYVVWSNNYGETLPGAPGAVPEPATMALLAMGALALIRRRR